MDKVNLTNTKIWYDTPKYQRIVRSLKYIQECTEKYHTIHRDIRQTIYTNKMLKGVCVIKVKEEDLIELTSLYNWLTRIPTIHKINRISRMKNSRYWLEYYNLSFNDINPRV